MEGKNIVILFWQCQCCNRVSACVVEDMVTAQADTKTSLALIWLQRRCCLIHFFVFDYSPPFFSSFFLFSIWQLVPLVSAAGCWDW